MSYRNREVEIKLVVRGQSLGLVDMLLEGMLQGRIVDSKRGSSYDTYWSIPNPEVEADFLRIRCMPNMQQITVKGKDRGDNIDRLEIDIDSVSNTRKVDRLITAAFGPSSGAIRKTYRVHWLDMHTTISSYIVTDPSKEGYVFVEVETTNRKKLAELQEEVVSVLKEASMDVSEAPGSLYEMFITKTKELL